MSYVGRVFCCLRGVWYLIEGKNSDRSLGWYILKCVQPAAHSDHGILQSLCWVNAVEEDASAGVRDVVDVELEVGYEPGRKWYWQVDGCVANILVITVLSAWLGKDRRWGH